MEEKKEIRILETWSWGGRTQAQSMTLQEPPVGMGISFPPETPYGPIAELAWENKDYCDVYRLHEGIKEALLIIDNASPMIVREVKDLLAGKIGEDDLTAYEDFVTISLRCPKCGERWRVLKVKGEELPTGWYQCRFCNYWETGLEEGLDLMPYTKPDLDNLTELLGQPDIDWGYQAELEKETLRAMGAPDID